MSLPYQVISDNSGSLNSGSYLSSEDYNLFFRGTVGDLWFGTSEYDVIECSVFDLTSNQLSWGIFNRDKTFFDVSLTFQNDKNEPTVYAYKELKNDFISFKGEKILINPNNHLKTLGIGGGGYILNYNLVRNMVGSPENPLTIKEVSPSGKEIKLIPSGRYDNKYVAFALNQFQVKDVSPLLILRTKQCPYDQIYNSVKSQNESAISYLKYLFFLQDDADVTVFLKNIYEDYIKYTSLTEDQINSGAEPTQITRIQGIRTYFQNYLLSRKEDVSNFGIIENIFNEFTRKQVDLKFSTFQNQTSDGFTKARQFVYDFFTKYFYSPVTTLLESSYKGKYESYFRNALNVGNGRMVPIMDHGFIDERESDGDPLTILVKLPESIPNDLGTKTLCWISNISMVPFIFNAILKDEETTPTIKISPPDFTVRVENSNISNNNNTLYSIENLEDGSNFQEYSQITLNRKLSSLDIDYGRFENFINFSSAELRLSIFKNKIVSFTGLVNDLSSLDQSYSSSVSNGDSYPNYLSERLVITDQMQSIVDNFDGYETYLYKQGNYAYDETLKKFTYSDYVSSKDTEAQEFDRNNRDSFVNNTPYHILLDSQNDDYIIFLSMMGHYFDNIYNYILALPSQKKLEVETSSSFSKKVTGEMLNLFGWKTEDDSDVASILEFYSTGSLNTNTDDSRMKSIWNRILTNLPLIYKTKGTEECINILLSCYGIPSTYLTVKEYGGVDYSEDSEHTYTKNELVYMMGLYPSKKYTPYSYVNNLVYSAVDTTGISVRLPWIDNIKTIQFKLSIPEKYQEKFPYIKSEVTSSIGTTFEEFYQVTPYELGVKTPIIKQIYWIDSRNINISSIDLPSGSISDSRGTSSYAVYGWELGVFRDRGENMGRVYFSMISGSYLDLTGSYSVTSSFTGSVSYPPTATSSAGPGAFMITDPFPLFDGSIYNVMLRRNTPWHEFESGSEQQIPTKYDLCVRKNVDGRTSTYKSSSIIMDVDGNKLFSKTGQLHFQAKANIDYPVVPNSVAAVGVNVDKINLWDIPISDAEFVDYSNNYNSYAYSGSEGYKHLWCQIAPHYPFLIPSLVDHIRNESYYYTGHFNETDVLAGTGSLLAASQSAITSSRDYFYKYWIGHFSGSVPYPNVNYLEYFTPKMDNQDSNEDYIDYTPVSFSYDSNSCTFITSSSWPYTFKEYSIPVTYTTPKYGPNKLKNDKIKKKNQILESRLDPSSTSTNFGGTAVSPDSNQVGLFMDPQKYRNTDIIKYFGNKNIIEELADPSSYGAYRYETFARFRKDYNDSAPKYVFFNELSTLYRLYFDVSLFGIIRRLTPARSNLINGVLIEPNILERPKYQHKPISSSATEFNDSRGFLAEINLNKPVGEQLLWVNFNISTESMTQNIVNTMPPNYSSLVDLSYINEPNRIYDVNYGGNYVEPVNRSQFSQFSQTDFMGREGVVYETDLNLRKPSSGSVFFILKRWKRYSIYSRMESASLERPTAPDDSLYQTSSTYLYDIVVTTPEFYNSLAYTASALGPDPNGDLPVDVGPPPTFNHAQNTFKNTPDERLSNIKVANLNPFNYSIFDRVWDESSDTFFEIFNGYPRNHYIHKMNQFSPISYITMGNLGQTGSFFVKGKQTDKTTIGEDGLNNGTYPVESINVGNVNIIKSTGVINR